MWKQNDFKQLRENFLNYSGKVKFSIFLKFSGRWYLSKRNTQHKKLSFPLKISLVSSGVLYLLKKSLILHCVCVRGGGIWRNQADESSWSMISYYLIIHYHFLENVNRQQIVKYDYKRQLSQRYSGHIIYL